MRTRTITAAAALLIITLAGCGKSYDDITSDCQQALVARPDGDPAKPKACAKVKADDYTALLFSVTARRSGLIDKDGNVDKNKLLDGATAQP